MSRFAEKTKVPSMQSRMEIEKLLSRYHCQQFASSVDYMQRIAKVQFMAHDRLVRFTLMLPDPKQTERLQQEERRVWRSLLLVIKAKLEAVTTGISTFEEEFLAYVVMPGGRTVAEMIIPQIAEAYQSGRGQLLAIAEKSEGS